MEMLPRQQSPVPCRLDIVRMIWIAMMAISISILVLPKSAMVLMDCSGVADDDHSTAWITKCAALSCDEIHTENPTYQDGMYWIDPDGNGAVTAYCNMSLAGGGWTLVGKFTNQDGRSWAILRNWVGYNNFGNTTNLNDGADAKSELWYRMVVEDFLLNDHLNPTDYVHTDAGCIGGNSLADYFARPVFIPVQFQ